MTSSRKRNRVRLVHSPTAAHCKSRFQTSRGQWPECVQLGGERCRHLGFLPCLVPPARIDPGLLWRHGAVNPRLRQRCFDHLFSGPVDGRGSFLLGFLEYHGGFSYFMTTFQGDIRCTTRNWQPFLRPATFLRTAR